MYLKLEWHSTEVIPPPEPNSPHFNSLDSMEKKMILNLLETEINNQKRLLYECVNVCAL